MLFSAAVTSTVPIWHRTIIAVFCLEALKDFNRYSKFIPRTYGDDNDPLDVLVLCQEEILPLTIVDCKPIGVLYMSDGKSNDEKIIAVPLRDPSYNCYDDIYQLPRHIYDEVSNFFEVYKALEGVKTEVKDIKGYDDAIEVIKAARKNYIEKFC